MPRGLSPLDPHSGPAGEFARELRALRRAAGEPPLRALAHRSGFAPSTLSAALAGRALPSLDVALALAQACGGDAAVWRARWLAVAGLIEQEGARAGGRNGARAGTGCPRQLPRNVHHFTGRAEQAAALDATLGRAGCVQRSFPIAVLCGPGGIGKTALALHWAHLRAGRFPDGQLYANLRGFDPSGRPADAAEVLRGFLTALNVAPQLIPRELEARSALFRTVTADLRAIVVLDNAAGADQIAPLLPGEGKCAVLVTSRVRLDGLAASYGALVLRLDELSPWESEELLAGHVGRERLAAEAGAGAELLVACGGLPLALSVLAARIGGEPQGSLTALAEELRDTASRLDALDTVDGTVSLRAVLSWSLDRLEPDLAEAFVLLSLAPGPEFGAAAAAALLGEPPARTRAILRRLEAAHLLSRPLGQRYRQHDLVRLYALECAQGLLTEDRQTAARRRVVDHYLHSAIAGERALRPFSPDLNPAAPVAGSEPVEFDGPAAALTWFEDEYMSLHTLRSSLPAQDAHPQPWHLAWALDTFQFRRALRDENIILWSEALAAAEATGTVSAIPLAHRCLGRALSVAGQHDAALRHLNAAAALDAVHGSATDRGHSSLNLAWAWELAGDNGEALACSEAALRSFEACGDTQREAVALNAVGWYRTMLGEHESARACCERALDLIRIRGNPAAQASTLDSLGQIAYHSHHFEESARYYHETLELYAELGNEYSTPDTLCRLAEAHAATGRTELAQDTWRLARDRYEEQRRFDDAERVGKLLAEPHRPPL